MNKLTREEIKATTNTLKFLEAKLERMLKQAEEDERLYEWATSVMHLLELFNGSDNPEETNDEYFEEWKASNLPP